jgi:hypothetical protein
MDGGCSNCKEGSEEKVTYWGVGGKINKESTECKKEERVSKEILE